MTTAAVEGALRAIGYDPSELLPHGLRSTASTLEHDDRAREGPRRVARCDADPFRTKVKCHRPRHDR